MSDQYGRYYPEKGPAWLMALSGNTCQIIHTDSSRLTIRLFKKSWGIKGGMIINCPASHVQIIGKIE